MLALTLWEQCDNVAADCVFGRLLFDHFQWLLPCSAVLPSALCSNFRPPICCRALGPALANVRAGSSHRSCIEWLLLTIRRESSRQKHLAA